VARRSRRSDDVRLVRQRLLFVSAGMLLLAACEMKRENATEQSHPRDLGIGRVASDSEIRAWNIDVNGSGAGLPAGSGTYERGARVYAEKCASCHGPKGEGAPPN